MTVDRLLDIAVTLNPGFFIMAAALLALVARDPVLRGLAVIGGPAAAMTALLYAPAFGVTLSKVDLLGLELILYRPDSLSTVFGLAFIIAAGISGIYSLHRVSRAEDAASLIYGGAAVTAVLSGDLVTMFIAWELTAIASALLIAARRSNGRVRAVMRYLALQLASGLLLLAGVGMHVAAGGPIGFEDMAPSLAELPVGVMDINAPGAVLILAAFGIKAAFPLVHNWLTDAYPRASETGAVVLSAFTTKLAVYALARYFAGLDALVWIGAAMTVFPVFFAVIENDLRRVLSYSLINQVGFMVCAVGIGTELAINGSAAHAFAHIIYKSLLFMSMGAVLLRTGTTKGTNLGGLHRTMPFTTIFCLIGAASISAVPFFSGFAAKSMVMSASHADIGLMVAWFMLLFASAGVLEHSGIKIPYFAFFGHDGGKRPQEAPFNMLLAMAVAAALCIWIGVSPRWLYELLPYRDAAMEYLAQDLFTTGHLIQQAQLLIFAVFAFMLLKVTKLYPPERPGVILDVEWIWRKGLPHLGRALARPAGAPAKAARSVGGAALRGVKGAARQAFASDGVVARKVPLAGTAVWTLAILGIVIAVSLLS